MAGSSITQMALPVLAVLHLDASTAQVAWLMFLGQLPPALFALHAGALADRSLLCNGIVAFGDTGAVLPDGQIQEPRRAGRTAA
ncbi:DUF5999 family protein [Streptomyces albidoflavus]|uniref:DUF5999 family protein n=1 Tax=Streptomyces albidoflavus TaxID=1886 RepID=UPI0033D0E678